MELNTVQLPKSNILKVCWICPSRKGKEKLRESWSFFSNAEKMQHTGSPVNSYFHPRWAMWLLWYGIRLVTTWPPKWLRKQPAQECSRCCGYAMWNDALVSNIQEIFWTVSVTRVPSFNCSQSQIPPLSLLLSQSFTWVNRELSKDTSTTW